MKCRCGLSWDVADTDPPTCRPVIRGGAARLEALKAAGIDAEAPSAPATPRTPPD